MAANSRLTVAVHALAWMHWPSGARQQVLTSDQVAASVNTNPVVIRRSLGDLRGPAWSRYGTVPVRLGAGPGARADHPARRVRRRRAGGAVGMHHTEPTWSARSARASGRPGPPLRRSRPGYPARAGPHLDRGRTPADRAGGGAPVTRIVELRQYTLRPGQRDVFDPAVRPGVRRDPGGVGMRSWDSSATSTTPTGSSGCAGSTTCGPRRGAGPLLRRARLEGTQRAGQRHDDRQRRRPAAAPGIRGDGFPAPATARPPVGHATPPAVAHPRHAVLPGPPFDAAFLEAFDRQVRPQLVATGAAPLAAYRPSTPGTPSPPCRSAPASTCSCGSPGSRATPPWATT